MTRECGRVRCSRGSALSAIDKSDKSEGSVPVVRVKQEGPQRPRGRRRGAVGGLRTDGKVWKSFQRAGEKNGPVACRSPLPTPTRTRGEPFPLCSSSPSLSSSALGGSRFRLDRNGSARPRGPSEGLRGLRSLPGPLGAHSTLGRPLLRFGAPASPRGPWASSRLSESRVLRNGHTGCRGGRERAPAGRH